MTGSYIIILTFELILRHTFIRYLIVHACCSRYEKPFICCVKIAIERCSLWKIQILFYGFFFCVWFMIKLMLALFDKRYNYELLFCWHWQPYFIGMLQNQSCCLTTMLILDVTLILAICLFLSRFSLSIWTWIVAFSCLCSDCKVSYGQ